MDRLREIDTGIWTLDGNPIRFLGMPYQLRSTIVDVGSGCLFVHSPVQLEVAAPIVGDLGRVGHLVSPNHLHHLFLGDWQRAFPAARLYAPPGLRPKRPDLSFDTDLGDLADPAWSAALEQRVVRGSFFMEEVIFYHRASATLVLGDLIENHDPHLLVKWQRMFARANGMLAPHGTTPRNYRWTFWQRAPARKVMQEVLSWKPRRVIPMHGPCVDRDAEVFLRHAFAWLL